MATTTNFGWDTPDDTDLVKDGAAAIRTALNGVDTSFVDLKGGTINQVLAKNSNTDLDFKWVADASGMTNPMTTTGDVIYSSSGSTPARLGIGTANQILQVNSGATAPEWVTAAATNESWALVTSGTTTSGSSLALTGLGSYDKYMLVFAAFRPGTDDTMVVRVNNDSTASYRYVIVAPTMTNGLTSAQTSSFGNLSLISSDNAGAMSFTISGCKSTSGYKKFFGDFLLTNASPAYIPKSYAGVWESNSAVTSLDLVLSTYSFANGTYRLYGSN
jgi:hypothetical protein